MGGQPERKRAVLQTVLAVRRPARNVGLPDMPIISFHGEINEKLALAANITHI
jgi:hypothetical protein